MKQVQRSIIVAAGLVVLTAVVAMLVSPSVRAQMDRIKTVVLVANTPDSPVPVTGTVSVGNTPNVNVNRPVTALAFQALDVSFAALEARGNIDVSSYDQIRVVVENEDFPVDLVVNVIEGGEVVGILDVIPVPGCDGAGGCVGSPSISRVYDLPGRTLRFSTNADPRATGNVHIFGR